MRRAAVVLLLALLLLAGGCGPLSDAEYIQRADRICRQMNAKEAELEAVDALHEIRSYAQTGSAVVAFDQRARERLGKLKAPNELKDRVRTYLRALDRRLAHQRRAVEAAKRGDVATVIAMKFDRQPVAERQAAARIGLKVCGRH